MVWWVIGVCAFLWLALLFLPWQAEAVLSADRGLAFKIWLGRLIPVVNGDRPWNRPLRVRLLGIKLPSFSRKPRSVPEKEPDKGPGTAAEQEAESSGWHDGWQALSAVNLDTFLQIFRFFRDLAGHTKLKLEISGEFGFEDPAATGMVYGLACSLAGALGSTQTRLTPNFADAGVRGEVRLAGSLVPLVVICKTVITLFHPGVRKLLRAMARWGRTENSKEVRNLGS